MKDIVKTSKTKDEMLQNFENELVRNEDNDFADKHISLCEVSNKNGIERKINLYGGIGNHLLTSWVLKISDGSVIISDGDTLSHEIFITVLSILLAILSGICASYNPCGYFFFLFVPYYYFWDKVVGSLKVKKFIGDYITKDNMKTGDLDN